MNSRSILGEFLEAGSSVFVWTLLLLLTVFPLSGLLAYLVYDSGSSASGFAGFWLGVHLVVSLSVYILIHRRRGVRGAGLAARVAILAALLYFVGQMVVATFPGAPSIARPM